MRHFVHAAKKAWKWVENCLETRGFHNFTRRFEEYVSTFTCQGLKTAAVVVFHFQGSSQ